MNSRPESFRKRVYWIGADEVFRQTEARRLREIGFELLESLNTPGFYDRTSNGKIGDHKFTTLPTEVAMKLMSYDFSDNPINADISELLNAYFDAVIVAAHPERLTQVLKVYRGTTIYRTYGSRYSLSQHFVETDTWRLLHERDNFYIVPFTLESVECENSWFLDLCYDFVPHQLPDEVFDYTSTWRTGRQRSEITVSIPDIENPYYADVYSRFCQDFRQSYFRILGAQRTVPADPRILGTTTRDRLLVRLSESAGHLYPYSDNVCHLPPIEMMQIGGPVIYLAGSLLAKFGGVSSPGYAGTVVEARRKAERLLCGDISLAEEIIHSQEPIRARYDRDLVRPVFDRVFTKLIAEAVSPPSKADMPAVTKLRTTRQILATPSIVIPMHAGDFFHYSGGLPYATEGIPRVVEVMVDALIANTSASILVSCKHESEAIMTDFFARHIRQRRLSLYVLGAEPPLGIPTRNIERLKFIAFLNRNKANVLCSFVPHYYLFPEMLLANHSLTLYLPDYLPYLMPGQVFDLTEQRDARNKRTGMALAIKADRIITNSTFTRNYLPDAGFVTLDAWDKVVVAPLPALGQNRLLRANSSEIVDIESRLNAPFIFYPTANRPNKNLSLLLRILAHMKLLGYRLRAVLTCNLNSVSQVYRDMEAWSLFEDVTLLPNCSESVMQWLYENAAALCLTSTAEGNFPPQILEAVLHGTPVVATRLPTILEIVGSKDQSLLLCNPNDLSDFVDKLEIALQDRNCIQHKQADLLADISRLNSPEIFGKMLRQAFPNVVFDEAVDSFAVP